jgi:N-acyl-D-aspartate/D-glutamate deacylase
MGERAVRREAATADDLVAMQTLLVGALKAGALGFSTADTVGHRDANGSPTYARRVAAAELFALGEAMGRARLGVIQIFNDFYQENAGDFPTIVELARRSGRPLSFTFEQDEAWPEGFLDTVLAALDRENAAGVQLKAQVAPRAIGGLHSLEGSINPFMTRPSYRAIAGLPHAARVAALRDPDVRARILSEPDIPISDLVMSVTPRAAEWGKDPIRMAQRTFLMGPEPDYEQPIEQSLFGLVQASGRSGEEILYDHLLSDDGRGQVFVPVMNYVESDYEAVRRMMESPHAILGLSDGGAHVGYICDGSFPTYLLSHWTRDRSRGPRLRLEDAVRLQTTRPAEQMGLADRGRIAPGLRADLNIIDHARLKVGRPTLHNDLPAGGTRFLQGATGYVGTFVAGVAVRENDQPTGARPGRLVRGRKAA